MCVGRHQAEKNKYKISIKWPESSPSREYGGGSGARGSGASDVDALRCRGGVPALPAGASATGRVLDVAFQTCETVGCPGTARGLQRLEQERVITPGSDRSGVAPAPSRSARPKLAGRLTLRTASFICFFRKSSAYSEARGRSSEAGLRSSRWLNSQKKRWLAGTAGRAAIDGTHRRGGRS